MPMTMRERSNIRRDLFGRPGPFRPGIVALQRHRGTFGCANRNLRALQAIQATHVDPKVIRLGTFPVECIDAAVAAEIMPGHPGIPLIDRQILPTCLQAEFILVGP